MIYGELKNVSVQWNIKFHRTTFHGKVRGICRGRKRKFQSQPTRQQQQLLMKINNLNIFHLFLLCEFTLLRAFQETIRLRFLLYLMYFLSTAAWGQTIMNSKRSTHMYAYNLKANNTYIPYKRRRFLTLMKSKMKFN